MKTWAHSHKGLERAEFRTGLMDAELRRHDVEVIGACTATCGFYRPKFIEGWRGRILYNPPLAPPAPLYKGLDTHRRAIMGGEGNIAAARCIS
jgi:hypothetical protein